jgi:hypothetical protein
MMIVEEREFIMKAMKEHGLHLSDFFEGLEVQTVKGLSGLPLKRRSDVLLVDTKSLLSHPELMESCKSVFNTFSGVIAFHERDDEISRSWIELESGLLQKIVGRVILPVEKSDVAVLSNQLQYFWNTFQEQKQLQRHLAEFSQELNQVLQTAEWEMSKAKKIYEVLVPKRQQEIKGVNFYNKYASGAGGGAEFYDIHQEGHKVYQILVTSESYLISSSLLGLLKTHKKKDFNPHIFLKDALADIDVINSSKKKKSHVDLLMLELDLNALQLKSFGRHKAEFCSQLNGPISLETDQIYPLSRGEKFIVFSPGFLLNWKESRQKENVAGFVKNHQQLGLQELMTELFYQIRESQSHETGSEKRSQFLKRDATVVIMEINRHAIHSI